MNVIEALNARHSTRAFLSAPVEREKIDAILTAAARTPSWANTQAWEVFVVTGGTLARIREGFAQKYAEGAPGAPETPRPTEWTEAAKARMKQLQPDIARDCGDAAAEFGTLNQAMFNAPVVVYLCMDAALSQWSLYDIGAYSQSFMLAALEQGLGTIPAITLTLYPDVIRRELALPSNLKVTIGIALGYIDTAHAINNFISARDPLSETVRFCD